MGKSKIIGFWTGILILMISIFITPPEGMRSEAAKALGITLLMAIWWVTECIPIYATTFIPVTMFPLLGILDTGATSANYGHNYVLMLLGGFLEVTVDLNQKMVKGEKIALVRNAFGEIIKEYMAPEDGVVIGKSTNPANMDGRRIIYLGILE